MLVNLHVKNFALIEETEVNFKEGLNILTGETGAGKSIIIGSINYALGAKADYDVIRSGADYALVELIFYLEEESQRQAVKAMDLAMEEDGSLIISRKILPGRSVMKVGGETVTAKQVKELATLLIDIHGQHEHQSLLKPQKQMELLDDFAGNEARELKAKIAKKYKEYLLILSDMKKMDYDDASREREISLARYEVEEIAGANITPGEENELSAKYKKMQNGKKIMESLGKVTQYLGEKEENSLEQLGYAVKELGYAGQMDEELEAIRERLLDAESILSETYREIQNYIEDFSFEEETFYETEKRLDILNHLMTKYGSDTEKILAYEEKRRAELEKLLDLSGYMESKKKLAKELEEEIKALSGQLRDIRHKIAEKLSKEITAVLEDLNFLKVSFEIAVTEKESFGEDGADDVCFMISLNPGEKKKPVAEVASGGELSRIMLALKTVFAKKDGIGTLIFDEIDAGISGKTAWKVSNRLGFLRNEHQIICITHLPQIAAMADTHFVIEKKEEEGITKTSISLLEENAKVEEIARLLGSDTVTDAVRTNAEELLALAKKTKEN